MAHGWWGGRLPIGNLFSSKLIRLLVRYRLCSQRARNAVKQLLKPKQIQTVNSHITEADMQRLLSQGYDKINVGGGYKNLSGFVNIDFVRHPQVEREVVGNALDLSFVPDSAISQVHSNHMLEHLPQDQVLLQLRQYYRILRPDGILTLRVPNTLAAAYAFWFEPILETDREEFVAEGFPVDEAFGDPKDIWLYRDFYGLLHWFYADVGNPENEHLTRFTPTSLASRIEAAGFRIKRMSKPEALNIVVIAEKAA